MPPRTASGFYDYRPPGMDRGDWDDDGGFNRDRFRYATTQALGRELGAGRREDDAYRAFTDFDPRAAFDEYTAGSLAETRSALADELEDLTGSAVGAGRANTGFFDRDRGEVVKELFDRHNARTSQAALQTAGMRQNQLGTALDFGAQARNRYLALLVGAYDPRTGEDNAGGGLLGALGGVGGGVGGFFAGGPAGAAAGARIGSGLGNSF